jgi:hypothetical protein
VSVAGALVGLINGLIITRLKINPLITPLGTMSIGIGLVYTLSNDVTIPFANPGAGVLADKAIGDVAAHLGDEDRSPARERGGKKSRTAVCNPCTRASLKG